MPLEYSFDRTYIKVKNDNKLRALKSMYVKCDKRKSEIGILKSIMH